MSPAEPIFAFFQESRWLTPEEAALRNAWFDALPMQDKGTRLFEFEMMLKGLVRLGSRANWTGNPRKRRLPDDRSFAPEFAVAREIAERVVKVGESLSQGTRAPARFRLYADSVISRDESRFGPAAAATRGGDPALHLSVLLSSLEKLLDLSTPLAASAEVPFRAFSAFVGAVERELHRSVFFNPLAAIEFAPEYDGAFPGPIAEAIRDLESEPARKVAIIALLALFRLLRCAEKVESLSGWTGPGAGVIFAWLAALRSDLRALVIFLRRNTRTWLADGFGLQYEDCDSEAVAARFGTLEAEYRFLKPLGQLLASLGDQLRIEGRLAFEQRLPAIGETGADGGPGPAAADAMMQLRAFLQNAVSLILSDLGSPIDVGALLPDATPPELHLARLRRDIWMFQQIMRAFVEKAEATVNGADTWSGMASFDFVRPFVRYFRSLGYHLLRHSSYERFDDFIELIGRLGGGDVLVVQRFTQVVEACGDFSGFLDREFESISVRAELAPVPFDRKDAARTLKLFLRQ